MKTAGFADQRCRFVAVEQCQPSLLHPAKRSFLCGRAARVGTLGLCAVLALLFVACSSESKKPEQPAEPEKKGPELLTARSAFQKLYVAARGWNQDARPYRVSSVATSDGNGHDGKWAVWI